MCGYEAYPGAGTNNAATQLKGRPGRIGRGCREVDLSDFAYNTCAAKGISANKRQVDAAILFLFRRQ
jgi:hypothetical protein